MTGDPNHNKFIVVRTTARVAEIEADSYEEAAIIGDRLSDDMFKRDDRFDKKYVVCMWLQECRDDEMSDYNTSIDPELICDKCGKAIPARRILHEHDDECSRTGIEDDCELNDRISGQHTRFSFWED